MDVDFQLTANAVMDIHNNQNPANPVVQVTAVRKIPANQQADAKKPDRYRLHISDGVHKQHSVMLATQLNNLVEENSIKRFTVVRLKRFVCNEICNRRIVIILECDVLGDALDVIGNPENIPADGADAAPANAAATAPAVTTTEDKKPNVQQMNAASGIGGPAPPTVAPVARPVAAAAAVAPTSAGLRTMQTSVPGSNLAQPISSLNPYNTNRWVIRARVTSKPPVKTWEKETRSGKLFSVDLIDDSGEIRATGFNQQCDQLEPLLELGKVYIIRGGRVKMANRRFSTLKNSYEITFDDSTSVNLVQDDSSVPMQNFDFKHFADLANIECASGDYVFVDVIGIITDVGTLGSITVRSSGLDLSKRDIELVDRKAGQISCTLWGKDAEEFEEKGAGNGKVMAIKAARLSDYNGRSISVSRSTTYSIAPDIPESHSLRAWFDSEGHNAQTTKMSTRGGGGGGKTERIELVQVKEKNLGLGRDDGKGDYFSSKATITFIKKDGVLYQACTKCNKKVKKDDIEDKYHCGHCTQEDTPNFNWRMMLYLSISDFTGNTRLTCFQEQGEQILGITADELGKLMTTDVQAMEARLQQSIFKEMIFTCRAKADTWEGERRVRINGVGVEKINYVKESQTLLEKIKAYEK